jgi:hypothetical protein
MSGGMQRTKNDVAERDGVSVIESGKVVIYIGRPVKI